MPGIVQTEPGDERAPIFRHSNFLPVLAELPTVGTSSARVARLAASRHILYRRFRGARMRRHLILADDLRDLRIRLRPVLRKVSV
jgi:hypothetical protein